MTGNKPAPTEATAEPKVGEANVARRVRIVLFTVFPAAFIAFFPVEVIRHPDLGGVLAMLAAALLPLGQPGAAAQVQRPKHPVHIFFVGVGSDADIQVGRILADATNSAYQETTEKSLAAVLEAFGKYF